MIGNAQSSPSFNGTDTLVGGDELVDVVAFDPPVLVGYQFERESIDPRQAGEDTVCQSRQLTAVTARQVAACQGDLLLDEVEVIEQPCFRGHDPLFRLRSGRDDVIGVEQYAFIVREPAQQLVGPRTWIDPLLAREGGGVTLELLDAEQLRAQQIRVALLATRTARAHPGCNSLRDDYSFRRARTARRPAFSASPRGHSIVDVRRSLPQLVPQSAYMGC
jgi:hypothetical protein